MSFRLCGEIVNEKDPDNQEDIRIRMAFLAKKYALVGDTKAPD